MKFLFAFLVLLLTACSSKKAYPDKDICYILFDLKTNSYVTIYNDQLCGQRLPAASTFKIPLSLMAYDTGVLKDEMSPTFTWNGEKSSIEAWNKNQTPTSWMRDSVVWVSQLITPKIGAERIQKYLENFAYGNQDMSGGLKYAWLTPAPFIHESMKNSLKISGLEQVAFLRKMWRGELSASNAALIRTQNIMTHDVSSRGNILIGKTGSGFHDENFDLRLGWFVGHLTKGDDEYIVVLNFSDKQKQPAGSFGGREAKEMALKFLSDKGYW
jgi:beta-lactamase class D